jgi:2-polyprenyl-3-methyl-5-hydroxy-6-metoxy-1,4-benzoquinol methylase
VDGFDPFVPEFANRDVLAIPHDLVTSQHVIEHVDDPTTMLDDIVTAVTPGGLLVIGCPNAEDLDLNNAEEASFELHQPYHRHIPSERALIDSVVARGYDVAEAEHRTYWDTRWPWINSATFAEIVKRGNYEAEVLVEKPSLKNVLRHAFSPSLLYRAYFGYYINRPGGMSVVFRRKMV